MVDESLYPPVIVMIITYRRLRLAVETIKSVKANLTYPNIGFHIADDGSNTSDNPSYVQNLVDEIGPEYSITVSNAERGGVGKNMNLGIHAVLDRADLWLHLEDDWALRDKLDLLPCVQLLMEDETVGMVRLGRLSAGLQAQTFSCANKLWWRLKKNSNTYVFSGNAALRHRRFHSHYGPYKEGLMPGQTELVLCNKFNTTSGPDIVWPAWLNTEETFFHIGDSHSFKWYLETGGLTAEQAADKFEEMEKERV